MREIELEIDVIMALVLSISTQHKTLAQNSLGAIVVGSTSSSEEQLDENFLIHVSGRRHIHEPILYQKITTFINSYKLTKSR